MNLIKKIVIIFLTPIINDYYEEQKIKLGFIEAKFIQNPSMAVQVFIFMKSLLQRYTFSLCRVFCTIYVHVLKIMIP